MTVDLRSVLAGPIVRRASTKEVCVWFCFSHWTRVRVRVLDALPLLESPRREVVLGEAEQDTLIVAKCLNVVLVRIRAEKTFPAERTLAYEVHYLDSESKEVPLDHKELAYAPFPLPTFVLRSGYPVHVLHGSCRKPHGNGLDALPAADVVLEAAARERRVRDRPSALFLTGDQIYADDVPDAIAEWMPAFGKRLVTGKLEATGDDEKIPTKFGDLRLATVGPKLRDQIVPDALTSTEKKNHVIGFGEYAALYLYAWNPNIGPRDADLFAPADRIRVRRALANIATYMICDDHDVTDDWNLTAKWEREVRDSPLATRIVANARAALWMFQLWGNDPKDGDDERTLKLAGAVGQASKGRPAELVRMLADLRFHFVTPMFPSVVVLDTRTHRRHIGDDRAAALLDADSFEWLEKTLDKIPRGNPLVIVSPAPVIDLRVYGTLKELNAAVTGPAGPDLEDWEASIGVYELKQSLTRRVAGRTVIFLSGDVHFSNVMTELFDSKTGEPTLNLVQFTSSALKNAPGYGQRAALHAFEAEGFVKFRLLVFITERAQVLKNLRASNNVIVTHWLEITQPELAPILRVPEAIRDLTVDRTVPDFTEYRESRALVTSCNLGQLWLQDRTQADMAFLGYERGSLRRRSVQVPLTHRTWPYKTSDKQELDPRVPVYGEHVEYELKTFIWGFGVNQSELEPEQLPALNVYAEVLAATRDVECFLEGHASQTGPEANNHTLAKNRALAVTRYFAANGVPPATLAKLEEFGSSRPRVDQPGGELPINRRVEITMRIKVPIPPTRPRPPRQTSRRWSIQLGFSSEIGEVKLRELAKIKKVLELSEGIKGSLTIGHLRMHAEARDATGKYPVIESRWMVMLAGGLGYGFGVDVPLKKKQAKKIVDWLLPRMPSIDPGYNDFFTKKPHYIEDFDSVLFTLESLGGALLVANWALEYLRFPTMGIVTEEGTSYIPTGGPAYGGGVGAGVQAVLGVTAMTSVD